MINNTVTLVHDANVVIICVVLVLGHGGAGGGEAVLVAAHCPIY